MNTQQKPTVISRIPVLFALSFLLASCFPSPPKDDEGHATFAREAIPLMLGRPAYGVGEVEAVADIAQYLGRDAAARMLMEHPSYVDHWSSVLIDLLRLQRDASGGVAAQDAVCWGDPTRTEPDLAIAEWVRDHQPTDGGAPTPAWNMADLVRSSIALDDLSPLYRANLFTFSMRRSGNNGNTARNTLASEFLRTYLNRDPACLICHNPTYSTSNKENSSGDIVWRRLWTIPGHPEEALFGDYNDPVSTFNRVAPIWRPDVRKPAPGVGIRPWGISEDCVRDTNNQGTANSGTLEEFGFQALASGSSNFPGAAFGSLDGSSNPKVSLWELEQSLHDGVVGLRDGYERSSPASSTAADEFCSVIEVFSGNCTGCHGSSGGMSLDSDTLAAEVVNESVEAGSSVQSIRVVPNNLATSELWQRVDSNSGGYKMPLSGSLTAGEKSDIEDWITAGSPTGTAADCNASDAPEVDPDEAFAFLTATNLVDGIWMSAMGHRLTIDHGFPRDRKQRDMLWNLTEYTFLKQDWSLQAVLAKILRSKWYARRAPVISQGATAYVMPPILDPWVVADPTEVTNPKPHERANGQGVLVDRYLVNRLLRRISGAIGWKEPRTIPGGGYPSPLDRDLGQYLSPGTPGFAGINFQSLLALESQAGLCVKAGRSIGVDDYIDALVDGIDAFNVDNADAPITMGEAWATLKDRMIQDPTIERRVPKGMSGADEPNTEEEALLALLSNALGGSDVDLNTPTTGFSSAQLDGALRQACGVLVKTPQFLLTNITPRGYSDNDMPDPPRLSVCLDGEGCGYSGACSKWRGVLWGMGKPIACLDHSVSDWRWFFIIPGLFLDDLLFEIGPLTPIERPFRLPGELRPGDFDAAVAATANEVMADLNDGDRRRLGDIIPLDQRVAGLCPEALCGFVREPRTEQCLEEASATACGRLLPNCDPRPGNHIDFCNGRQSNLYDEGVFVTWAQGATVQEATGVRILSAGQWRWRNLQPNVQLRAGDLLDVPLTATLRVAKGDLTFGATALKRENINGVSRHLLSVSGPDIGRILAMPTKPGVLTAATLRKMVDSGAIDSRAPTARDWKRILGYSAKPWNIQVPTPEEIEERNEDFDALHFPPESGLAADGSDLPTGDDPDEPDGPGTPGDDDKGVLGNLWWLILVLLLIVVVYVLSRRSGR